MDQIQSVLYENTGCQGRTVFIVDDNDLVREMVCCILESEGIHVIAADSPTKALYIVEQLTTPPDLMICDMCMPIMSGPELYELIEQRFPDQPVLFISGFPDEYLERGCKNVSEESLLRKPFGSNQLVERVGLLLSCSSR